MTSPIPARDIIADALCRSGAGMPSPATLAKADKVIEYLRHAGWDVVERDGWAEQQAAELVARSGRRG